MAHLRGSAAFTVRNGGHGVGEKERNTAAVGLFDSFLFVFIFASEEQLHRGDQVSKFLPFLCSEARLQRETIPQILLMFLITNGWIHERMGWFILLTTKQKWNGWFYPKDHDM